jgi:hypothetical protein
MTEQQQPRARRNRLTLVLIFSIFLLPVAAAWWFFLHGEHWQRSTTNYGTLVVPARPVDLSGLQPLGTDEATDDAGRRRWTLLTVAGRSCDSRCESNLYKMRQLRLALGEDMRRVRRMLVLTQAPVDPAFAAVLKGHDGLQRMTGDAQALLTALGPFSGDGMPDPAESRYIYVVDPLGNLMMTYGPDAEPKPMLKDLQRLLKVSQVG